MAPANGTTVRETNSTHVKSIEEQHDVVRTETISIFDNHCCTSSDYGIGGKEFDCAIASAGKTFLLTYEAENNTVLSRPSASLIHSYVHPQGSVSKYGGNIQTLSNGNTWVGFGQIPDGVEYDTSTGEPLIQYKLARKGFGFPYRIQRQFWRGYPTWSPKIVAKTYRCFTRPVTWLWVSWNGDTETRMWEVRTSVDGSEDSWKLYDTFPRGGFETHIELRFGGKHGHAPHYFMVSALDKDWQPIVHGQAKAELSQLGVADPRSSCLLFDHPGKRDYLGRCIALRNGARLLPLLILVLVIELLSALLQRLTSREGQNSPPTYTPMVMYADDRGPEDDKRPV